MTELLSLFTERPAEAWMNLASIGTVLLHHFWLARLRRRRGVAEALLQRISRLFASLPPPQRRPREIPPTA